MGVVGGYLQGGRAMKIGDDEAIRFCQKFVNRYIRGWKVALNNRRTIVGLANLTKKPIDISRYYVNSKTITWNDLKMLLFYEIGQCKIHKDKPHEKPHGEA